jgi:hypothetical protein
MVHCENDDGILGPDLVEGAVGVSGDFADVVITELKDDAPEPR